MPMPKKKCDKCDAMCTIQLRSCPKCGANFKSKAKTNWAGVKIPPKVAGVTKPSTGRPRGRAPSGKMWDEAGKKWVDAPNAVP
eukprot:7312759-Prymnesium_polylepis.2